LRNQVNHELRSVTLGLGWDPLGGDSIDLDASCVCFDQDGKNIESISFSNLKNSNNSIRHSGDNLTGEGSGDDERIFIDMDKLPENVKAMVFTVTSFSGHPFSKIKNAYVRLFELENKNERELVRFELSGEGNNTALILNTIFRGADERWKIAAIGKLCNTGMFATCSSITGEILLAMKEFLPEFPDPPVSSFPLKYFFVLIFIFLIFLILK